MYNDVLILLEISYRKALYIFQKNKTFLILKYLAKAWFLYVLFKFGVFSNLVFTTKAIYNSILIFAVLDMSYKYFMLSINSINLSSYLHLMSKKALTAFISIKSIFIYSNILFVAIFAGYGNAELFFLVSIISLFNSLSIISYKFFSKKIIGSIIFFYLIIYVMKIFIGLNIYFLLTALLLYICHLSISFILIRNNINNEKFSRNRYLASKNRLLNCVKYTLPLNELILFIRNKRTFGLIMQGFLLFIVGALYLQKNSIIEPYYLFGIAIAFTGAFLFSFWQFVIGLDGNHFPFLITNVTLYDYLNGKVRFMYLVLTISFFVSMLIAVKYFPEKYSYIIAAYFFNVGINMKIMMYFGLLDDGAVDLSQSPFFNYEGINKYQFLSLIVTFAVPVFLFMVLSYFLGITNALFCLSILGVLGLIMERKFLLSCSKLLNHKKYKLVASFNAKF